MLPSNWLTILIGAAISLMVLIYAYQFIWSRLRRALLATAEDPDLRTLDLIARAAEGRLDVSGMKAHPFDPKLIRLARSPDEVILLLKNDGGAAQELRIETAFGRGTIIPADVWRAGELGHLRLDTVSGIEPDEITFTLRYLDPGGAAHSASFTCSVVAGTLVQR